MLSAGTVGTPLEEFDTVKLEVVVAVAPPGEVVLAEMMCAPSVRVEVSNGVGVARIPPTKLKGSAESTP